MGGALRGARGPPPVLPLLREKRLQLLRGYPNRQVPSPQKTTVPRDSGAGEMGQGPVVFRLFGPADEQVPEAVEPGRGALDDPAAGFLPRFFGLGFFAPRSDVGRVAEFGDDFAPLVVIIAYGQAPGLAGGSVGRTGGFRRRGQAGQRAFRQLPVVPVGSVQPQANRNPPRLGQEAALAAAFAAVRGGGARFFSRPTALWAASRRGPSRRNPGQSTRRRPQALRPRVGQRRWPAPLLEPTMGRAARANPRRTQGFPLRARAQHKENSVQRLPVRHPPPRAAQGVRLWGVNRQMRREPLPKRVRDAELLNCSHTAKLPRRFAHSDTP